jgi:undecaprenyl-phosphate galactose phosphotransferase
MRLPDVLESSALLQGSSTWRRGLEKPLLIIADIIALLVAGIAWRPDLAREMHGLSLESLLSPQALSDRLFIFLLVVVLAMGMFWLRGHYSRRVPFWHETRQVIKYCFFLALLDVTALFFANLAPSRSNLLFAWLTAPILIVSFRTLVKHALHGLGGWIRPALIVGTGTNARDCARAVESESTMGLRVAAFVSPDESIASGESHVDYKNKQYPVLPLKEALNWLSTDRTHLPQVFMALEIGQLQANIALVGKISRRTQHIYVVPAFRGLPLVGLEASHFFGQDMAVLWVPNNLARRGPQLIKRLFDIAISAALLVLLSPLLLLLTWKVSRGGPVLYGHQRIGHKGKPFICHKFRTMVPNADKVLDDVLSVSATFRMEWEKDHKLKRDPRVTPIGTYLRRTSLDELPQLWNVLKGDMSLVGPRPIVESELARYGENAAYYLESRPGITGLWQISGRNDLDYSARVQLDSWYVRNWSLWNDIVILLRTFRVVLKRRGAY